MSHDPWRDVHIDGGLHPAPKREPIWPCLFRELLGPGIIAILAVVGVLWAAGVGR